MTLFLETNIYQFFGRFHTMLVHLPIGFIVLAICFELISTKKKTDFNLAISYAFLFAALSGVLSVILGLMLASDEGYNESTLNIHKWTGISLTLVAFALFYVKRKQASVLWAKKSYPVLVVLIMGLLFVAGHNGGNLTHGSDYLLEHAPNSIRTFAGMKPVRERVTDLEEALVYEDVIHPILESKCNVCHNSDKAKGELLLVDAEGIMKGGENGAVIVPGDVKASELFRRITLNPIHKDFMPTEGRTPLTNEETMLIQWWIEEGATFEKKIVELNLTDRTKGYLKEVGIGLEKTFIESLELQRVHDTIIASIKAEGFKIKTVTNNSTLLDVSYSPYAKTPLTGKKMDVLLKAKTNVVWLNLSGIDLSKEVISKIGGFKHLVEFRASNTNFSNTDVKQLENLRYLEYLNLYGNPISDASIASFTKLTSLQKLYLWKTNLSDEGLKSIRANLKETEIVSGI